MPRRPDEQQAGAAQFGPDVASVEDVSVDTRHWIGGQRVASATTFDDISPIDETVIAKVHAGGQQEVDAAVAAARATFPAWAAMSRPERAELLRAVADGVDKRTEDLSRVETRDNGACCARTGVGSCPASR